MTQEEILEEAKSTEKVNLESLKKYEEMELEAKRRATRSGDRTVKGPAIRLIILYYCFSVLIVLIIGITVSLCL